MLTPTEIHYMEKNPRKLFFLSLKTLISFDWRKKDMNILDGIRVSTFEEFIFWKWTNPLIVFEII